MREIRSEALLLRAVTYGESDLILTLFTETDGRLSAIARGARKGGRRTGGALEPFHTLQVHLADRGGDLVTLKEAQVAKVRGGVVASLTALEAAGEALRWVRHLCPPRTPEPAAWGTLTSLLDRLDALGGASPRALLAKASARLLSDVGYALELERCISCGKPCPEGRVACVDVARGGIVCVDCGGARLRLASDVRLLALAAQQGEDPVMTVEQAEEILTLTAATMAAHTELGAR